jgi:hypothetical protein
MPSILDANVVAMQLDVGEVMRDIEHYLRSEYFNEKNQRWEVKPGGKALVNDMGVNNLMALVRGHLDKNMALTYFTEEQVFNIIMRPLSINLVFNIRNHWETYEMDKANADLVMDIILDSVFASIMRSREGATIDLFKNTQNVTTNFDTAKKKNGLFGLGLFNK